MDGPLVRGAHGDGQPARRVHLLLHVRGATAGQRGGHAVDQRGVTVGAGVRDVEGGEETGAVVGVVGVRAHPAVGGAPETGQRREGLGRPAVEPHEALAGERRRHGAVVDPHGRQVTGPHGGQRTPAAPRGVQLGGGQRTAGHGRPGQLPHGQSRRKHGLRSGVLDDGHEGGIPAEQLPYVVRRFGRSLDHPPSVALSAMRGEGGLRASIGPATSASRMVAGAAASPLINCSSCSRTRTI